MIKVRTATELFAFSIINRVLPLYALPPGKGYDSLPPRNRYDCFTYEPPEMLRALFLITTILLFRILPAQETSTTPEAVDELFHEGEKAYRNGGYAEAIQLFTQVLEIDNEHLNAYLQRGFCHSLQREYQDAISDFSSVISRKQDHLWAYTSRGSAYGKLGKQDLAMQDFNTVLQLDPRNQEAYNNRGWAKKASGDTKGACQDWGTSKKMGNAEAKIILKNNQCK